MALLPTLTSASFLEGLLLCTPQSSRPLGLTPLVPRTLVDYEKKNIEERGQQFFYHSTISLNKVFVDSKSLQRVFKMKVLRRFLSEV